MSRTAGQTTRTEPTAQPDAQTLPNFCKVEDVAIAMASYFAGAAEIIDDASRRTRNRRDSELLAHMARSLHALHGSLMAYSRSHPDAAATWIQTTPDQHLPAVRNLEQLVAARARATELVHEMLRGSTTWIEIFSTMATNSTSPAARELHRSWALLLESWNQSLSLAYAQQTDL